MREIKFRVWTGTLMLSSQDIAYVVSLSGEALRLNISGSSEPILAYHREPKKEIILMQFTGPKDKNGKEVYEGDIIMDDKKHIGIVEWSGAGFTQKVETPKGTQWWSLHNRYEFQEKELYYHEVIGNIYENPELLKEIK